MPAIGAAFIAPAACPCCWATYGGLLGAGFLGAWGGAYLLPLTVVFMALALVVLALGSIKRRSYGPLVLATFAASAVLAGRFWLDWRWLVIAGALSLFAAAVWNAWPRRVRKLTKGVTTATPA